LAGCGRAAVTNPKRTSILDVSVSQEQGKDDHASDLRGPLTIASSMAESLLLEYADGMQGEELGWGCLDEEGLSGIMQLHEAEADFTERTPVIARMNGSNLLEHILAAIEQHVSGKVVRGAPGKPSDRALFLVGHDTNIASVAGLLGLHWIIDGRRDDTPPSGALTFELWRSSKGAQSVRLYYTAQSLHQMRAATPLTLASLPERVSVFVPDCSRPDMSCTLDSFAAAVQGVVDPTYVRMGLPESAATPGSVSR
jgi:4-phytase / acid phosphatase